MYEIIKRQGLYLSQEIYVVPRANINRCLAIWQDDNTYQHHNISQDIHVDLSKLTQFFCVQIVIYAKAYTG